MLTISEMMNKSPLSPDEDKLLFYSAAALSILGMVSTVVWKAYKLCGGRKRYIVNSGFTEVVVVEPVKPVKLVTPVTPVTIDLKPLTGAEHEITQL